MSLESTYGSPDTSKDSWFGVQALLVRWDMRYWQSFQTPLTSKLGLPLDDETVNEMLTNSTSIHNVAFGVGHVHHMWTNSERDVRYPQERPISLECGVRLVDI